MSVADLVSLDEVSDRYRVTKMTLLRWRKRGLLPEPIKMGRQRYWRAADLAAVEARKD
jgi:DNA-binding transcriptional MerR regulator